MSHCACQPQAPCSWFCRKFLFIWGLLFFPLSLVAWFLLYLQRLYTHCDMHQAPHAPSADNLQYSLRPELVSMTYLSCFSHLHALLYLLLSSYSRLYTDARRYVEWCKQTQLGCWQAIDAIVSFFFSLAFH